MTNDIKVAIDAANKKFSEGFTKSNASITASGFTDDAVVFPPDANMIQGKRAIEEFWKAVMASGVKEVTLNTVELTVSGDYAHESGTGILNIQPQDGTPTKQNIKYVIRHNFLCHIFRPYRHKVYPPFWTFPSISSIKSRYSFAKEILSPVAKATSCGANLPRNILTRL